LLCGRKYVPLSSCPTLKIRVFSFFSVSTWQTQVIACHHYRISTRITPLLFQKMEHMPFPGDGWALNFFFVGESLSPLHTLLIWPRFVMEYPALISGDAVKEIVTRGLILFQKIGTSLHSLHLVIWHYQSWNLLSKEQVLPVWNNCKTRMWKDVVMTYFMVLIYFNKGLRMVRVDGSLL
jgi:hypothetical protein